MTLKFGTAKKRELLAQGQETTEQVRHFIRKALGLIPSVAEATPHFILSGPPGVSKSHTVRKELTAHKVPHVFISPGTSEFNLIADVAMARYLIPAEDWLTVILDDADQVVFKNYDTVSKWRRAMEDSDDSGPMLCHNKNNTTNIRQLPTQLARDAVKSFMNSGSTGISIPTDRIRFLILCNIQLNGSDRSENMREGKNAIKGRVTYRRISASPEQLWGICAYILSNTQPFGHVQITDAQKLEILNWLFSNLDGFPDLNFRTVRKLASHMLDNPDDYESFWDQEKAVE